MVLPKPPSVDLHTLTEQLGRRPHGALAVAHRCPVGHPAVLLTYPLRRRRGRLAPFPSHLWLTCPRLSTRLADLERTGVIARLQRLLVTSPSLKDAFAEDHRRCIAHRWNLLTDEDRLAIGSAELTGVFRDRGIGGVRRWMSIKCLHLHYAHHLVLGNTIGRLLAASYGIHPCRQAPSRSRSIPRQDR